MPEAEEVVEEPTEEEGKGVRVLRVVDRAGNAGRILKSVQAELVEDGKREEAVPVVGGLVTLAGEVVMMAAVELKVSRTRPTHETGEDQSV